MFKTLATRWKTAGEVVKAYENLPPTWNASNMSGAWLPDATTPGSCKTAMDNVNKAEAAHAATFKKK